MSYCPAPCSLQQSVAVKTQVPQDGFKSYLCVNLLSFLISLFLFPHLIGIIIVTTTVLL